MVMEATGDYWKPFYYLLEDGPFEVLRVNAHEATNVPGRKTDVADAAWLAQLAAHGLLRASFVPPVPIRLLRDLTRTRTAITRERTREAQRLEKVLEDAGLPVEGEWKPYYPSRRIAKCYRYFRSAILKLAETEELAQTEAALRVHEAALQAVIVKIEVASHADAFVLFESLNICNK